MRAPLTTECNIQYIVMETHVQQTAQTFCCTVRAVQLVVVCTSLGGTLRCSFIVLATVVVAVLAAVVNPLLCNRQIRTGYFNQLSTSHPSTY